MKKLSQITSIILAISMSGIAQADKNNWTGFYAGADVNVVFNNVQLDSQQIGFTLPSETCNVNSNFGSNSPGIQLGYLHQFPNAIVTGIEANMVVNTNQQTTLVCQSNFNTNVYDDFSFRNQMQTSIKGRVGRALIWKQNSLLPYLTAGVSFANVSLSYQNEGGDYYSQHNTHAGWLIGAGVEWAFREHWSLRGEYNYVGYGKAITMNIPSVYGLIDPNGKASVDLSSNNIVMAVNYWI